MTIKDGAVVERVSGMPFNDYMNQKLWDPAGMPLTTLSPTEVISTGNYATGYLDGQPLAPNEYYYTFVAPAGFAFSTPTELVRWALRLQSGGDEVLTADSKNLMQTPHVGMGYLPWMSYGYGVMITDWRDKTDPDRRIVVYDHGGNIYGGSSQLFWIPESGVVVSILSNTIRSLGNAAACAVQVLADIEPIPGDETKIPPAGQQTPPPPVAGKVDMRTAGYDWEPGYDWTVKASGQSSTIAGRPCREFVATGDADYAEARVSFWACDPVPGVTRSPTDTVAAPLRSVSVKKMIFDTLAKHGGAWLLAAEEQQEPAIAPTMVMRVRVETLEVTTAPPGTYDMPPTFKKAGR